MNQATIDKLLSSAKRIIETVPLIQIPNHGSQSRIELKDGEYLFYVDLNRSGHKKPKCTYQLRESVQKDKILLRLDLVGRTHKNPPGDFELAESDIPCPHMHIANEKLGTSIAYPLDHEYVKMFLKEEELENLIFVFKTFLNKCIVTNTNEYDFELQDQLF